MLFSIWRIALICGNLNMLNKRVSQPAALPDYESQENVKSSYQKI